MKTLKVISLAVALGGLFATPAAMVSAQEIERKGEGRHFYTTIRIPANAETLYLSGSGASPMEDGTWGDMEQQTIDTVNIP